MSKLDIIRSINFGERVAEEEIAALSAYFVETDNWNQILDGRVDVIYGPKGSGKSALYALLTARRNELFDRGVVLIAAENPQGAPAFRGVADNKDTTEQEFNNIWKLYFVALLHAELVEFGAQGQEMAALEEALVGEGLAMRRNMTLAALVQGVFQYVRRFMQPQSIETTLKVDPHTQLPVGFSGKITFSEQGRLEEPGVHSVDTLLALANSTLKSLGLTAWICLDRLDVAFAESGATEVRALRALFRTYLDLKACENVSLKIFLRSDIWSRITEDGFREASHITRHVHISWDAASLVNLMIKRTLHNEPIRQFYGVNEELASTPLASQEAFLHRMLPAQVDVGPNKPSTVNWLLSRTRDGLMINAPRELIHLLNSLRAVQAKKLELGESEPDKEQLFSSKAVKDALPEVSRIRLEQTIYAEHAELKQRIVQLTGEKATQSLESLAAIWKMDLNDAQLQAQQLMDIGLFEIRGNKSEPTYWVPFLYRDALKLVQGQAE